MMHVELWYRQISCTTCLSEHPCRSFSIKHIFEKNINRAQPTQSDHICACSSVNMFTEIQSERAKCNQQKKFFAPDRDFSTARCVSADKFHQRNFRMPGMPSLPSRWMLPSSTSHDPGTIKLNGFT